MSAAVLPQAPDGGAPSLKRTALHGSAWTLLGFGLAQVLRMGSNIVLAALLFQEAFALMAIVIAIIQGLSMFSDLGLGPSVVHNKRGDDRSFLDTAWTIQVIRGVAIAAIACLLAWPIAAFYAQNDPMAWELLWLLPLVAAGTLISAFQSSKLMTAVRHISLARVTLIDLTAQVAGIGTMITFAVLTRSLYSLAAGAVVTAIVHCVLSHLALDGPRNHFAWDKRAVSEIVRFGKWIFLSTIISFLALQIDRLVFARLFPLHEVGVYAIAASIAAITPMLMGRLQSMIAFPLYSRMLAHKHELNNILERSKAPMYSFGGYLVALSIACAQPFVDAAYDSRYELAGLYIAVLAAGSWFAILDGVYGAAFLAIGRSKLVALINAIKVVVFCLALIPAIRLGGLFGAVLAVAFSDAAKFAVTLLLARRVGLTGYSRELLYTLLCVTITLCALILSRSSLLDEAHPVLLLCVQITVVSVAFAPFMVMSGRRALSATAT